MSSKNIIIGCGILILLMIIAALAIFNIHKPEPKRGFTELYFVNKLPKEVKVNQDYIFSFAIRNMEKEYMMYNYTVLLSSDVMAQGNVYLKHNQTSVINQTFKITKTNNTSIPIVVKLLNKNEEIHFWINIK